MEVKEGEVQGSLGSGHHTLWAPGDNHSKRLRGGAFARDADHGELQPVDETTRLLSFSAVLGILPLHRFTGFKSGFFA